MARLVIVRKLTRIEREARVAIVDDALSKQEEARLDQLIPSLGLSWETVGKRFPDLLGDILLAKSAVGNLTSSTCGIRTVDLRFYRASTTPFDR